MGLVLLAAQGRILFQDPTHDVELLDFDKVTALSSTRDRLSFEGSGNPLKIVSNALGLTLTARQASGEATQRPNGSYAIASAHARGDAVLVLSSSAREQYEIGRRTRTALSPEHTEVKLTSNQIDYAAGAGHGTVSLPDPLAIAVDTAGSQNGEAFEQKIDLTGSSGTVELDPAAKGGTSMLRTGAVAGPVKIQFSRKEPKQTMSSTAVADRLSFDFTGPSRQVVLSGNVHVTGMSATYSGEANADKLVITLDSSLQPIRYDFSGTPATTRVHTGGSR